MTDEEDLSVHGPQSPIRMPATRRSLLRVCVALFFVGLIAVVATSGTWTSSKSAASSSAHKRLSSSQRATGTSSGSTASGARSVGIGAPSSNGADIAGAQDTSLALPQLDSRFVVGLQVSLSGKLAGFGQQIVNGAQLAVESINGAQRDQSAGIDLRVEDDRSSARRAEQVANSFVSRHAAAVIGPEDPATLKPVLSIYRHAAIPIINLASDALVRSDGVSVAPVDSQIALVEAQEITEVLGAQRVGILYDLADNPYAARASVLQGLLASSGVGVDIQTAVSSTDVAGALSTLGAKHPDVLYLALPPGIAAVAASDAVSSHIAGSCIADMAGPSTNFVDSAASAATFCKASALPGVADMPLGHLFADAYESHFFTPPSSLAAFAYDAVEVLSLALAKHSTHVQGAPSLVASLQSVTGVRGVTGSLTFDGGAERKVPPVYLYDIDSVGSYGIDPGWAAFAGYRTS